MMTLSPINPDLFYPIMGWSWGQEDPTIHQYNIDPNNNNNNILLPYAQTSEPIIFADHSLPLTSPDHQQQQQQFNLRETTRVNSSEGNVITGLESPTSLKAKKLNHNASERDRRKRINDLYSSLRSLLPAADHKKKLSIPATVSRVVRYIPELQKEVNKLVREKEEMTSRICKEKKSSGKIHPEKKISSISSRDPPAKLDISAREIGDREITIQMCVTDDDSEKWRFPEVLQTLEDAGFLLIGISCHTSGKRLFRNMHFKQVQGSHSIECDALEREVLYLYQTRNSF